MDPTAALITIHLLQFFFFSILLLQSIHFSSRFFLLFSEERLCVSVDSAFLFLCTTKSGRLGPPRDIYSSKGRHRFNTFTELYSPTHCLFVFKKKKKTLPPLTKKKTKAETVGVRRTKSRHHANSKWPSLSLFSPSFYWAHYLSFVSVGYILAKGSALSTLFLI